MGQFEPVSLSDSSKIEGVSITLLQSPGLLADWLPQGSLN